MSYNTYILLNLEKFYEQSTDFFLGFIQIDFLRENFQDIICFIHSFVQILDTPDSYCIKSMNVFPFALQFSKIEKKNLQSM